MEAKSPHNNLSVKLLLPMLLCGIAIIALISAVTYYESEITRVKHVQQQATEFSESFLMAIEVNSSLASIVRTTNSLGTYQGIEEIFVVGAEDERIIASNKNRYVGVAFAELPDRYARVGIERVFREGGRIFSAADDGRYVFAYRARILSQDKARTLPIVIVMLLNSEGISTFLKEFRDAVMVSSALAFVAALVLLYLFVKRVLLKRIATIVEVIESPDEGDEPRLCPIGADDELGRLVAAYNASLVSDYEHATELVAANRKLEVAVEELEVSRAQLANSNQDLERFAYVAAHDLKAPLRRIKGFAELLSSELADGLDAEQREYLGFITSSADGGQGLIDDILSYSRLESDDAPEAICLDEVLARIRGGVSHRQGEFVLHYGDLPEISGSEAQLSQLFENLVGNGLKYNDSAVPRIGVEAIWSEDGCEVCVSDNGIGVPAEHHDKIFEMFTRVHGGSKYEGSGVGLAICKRIMELHDGSISVAPSAGGGTTFTCWFPQHRLISEVGDATNLHTAG